MGGGFFWYTNNGPKIIHISDIPITSWDILAVCIFIVSIIRMFKVSDRSVKIRDMLIAAMFFSALFADYIYYWSSGGHRLDAIVPLVVGMGVVVVLKCISHFKSNHELLLKYKTSLKQLVSIFIVIPFLHF